MKKHKVWLESFLLILGGILSGVLLSEMGLRVAGIEGVKKPESYIDSDTNWYDLNDPYRGWAMRPGASGWWRGEGERSYIKANSDGLRDREHTKAKPKNTLRIAVLGDSFTEALQVPIEKTFWAEMERRLNKKCKFIQGRTVEVINFGVQGYGTTQELMTLRHKVWDYDPDVVLLAFYAGNDLINNSKKLEFHQRQPFYVYDKQGNLVLDMSFREMPIEAHNYLSFATVDYLPTWLVNHSRILQVIRKVDLDNKKRTLQNEELARYGKNFREPTTKVWRDAWKITEGVVALMAKEVKAKKAEFLMVMVTDPMQVHPHRNIREKFMKDNKITDLFYPEKRMEALSVREQFSLLTLAQFFQMYAEKYEMCLHGFKNAVECGGHWNADGHRLAGEKIAEQLCQSFQQSQSKQPQSQSTR
ncbi:MAG: SGNH/GDSL hydrolase family protein [Actinomycetota bacterium]